MSTEVLRLDAVSVVRNGSTLLDELSWTVRESERWIVLGPNGAGKTTAMRIAAAQLFPTTGTVEILGERLGAVDVFELRPRIGVTSAALAGRIPERERVRDVVITASYAVIGRWREAYDAADVDRAEALLSQLGCGHLVDRTFGTLSEGERKRVQIARALMTDPELLLLDEPGAGLDLGAREDLVRRLSALAADEYAPVSVLVTHHVEEIPPAFTHCLMLREGRPVASGPIEDVLTAEALSKCFGIWLDLDRVGGRWIARGTA
ncbi:MAG: ABC transporter ATP-binding protein [Streptosporangiales bacterium]|nr:ABC transporter ATP-binding protein [Streptosporangiales bacterium]MBO0890068.1 ABC transporter ATP-binding protein [Acidothermales bacterium]